MVNNKPAAEPTAVTIPPDEVADELLGLLRTRDDINARIDELQQYLVDAVAAIEMVNTGTTRDEGSYSTATSRYKFTATRRVNRKVIADRLPALREKYGADTVAELFTASYRVSLTALRKMAELHPSVYADMAEAIEAKPGKPALDIKDITH